MVVSCLISWNGTYLLSLGNTWWSLPISIFEFVSASRSLALSLTVPVIRDAVKVRTKIGTPKVVSKSRVRQFGRSTDPCCFEMAVLGKWQ